MPRRGEEIRNYPPDYLIYSFHLSSLHFLPFPLPSLLLFLLFSTQCKHFSTSTSPLYFHDIKWLNAREESQKEENDKSESEEDELVKTILSRWTDIQTQETTHKDRRLTHHRNDVIRQWFSALLAPSLSLPLLSSP